MFNLAEKKTFMADLVSQVVGDGTKSWTRTLEPDHCLAQELLRLEDLALFKMQDFRLLFVAKCLHLHHQSGKAHTIVGRNSFDLLTDMFRVILREGNNDSDFLAVRMVYQAASLFGIYVGDHVKTILMTLRKHEAWRNPELWGLTLDELVARDKQRWMNLQGVLQHVLACEVQSEQLIKLMIFFRLRALVRAMLELRTPIDMVESLVSRCKDVHGVEFRSDEELTQALDPSTCLWVLDVTAKAHAAGLPPPGGRITPDPLLNDEMFFMDTSSIRGNNNHLKGQSTISIQAIVRWASEFTLRAAHGSSLGFSARQELLRFALERIAPDPPRLWAACRSTGSNLVVASPRAAARLCLCGRPYEEWRLVGAYAPSLHTILSTPSFICEECFRLATNQRTLNMETTSVHEGTLLATLRLPMTTPCPPQSVGCASVPDAEIRTPTSLSAFWAPASPSKALLPAPPHRRKNSRDRLASRKGQQQPQEEAGVDASVSIPTGGEEPEGGKQPACSSKEDSHNNTMSSTGTGATDASSTLGGHHKTISSDARSQTAAVVQDFKSILQVGIEVLKHGRMGRPHVRIIFLDALSSEIIWCSKEDTISPATMRASGRGGVLLDNLKDVKVTNEKKRLLVLIFKERSLTLEATSAEQFDFLLQGFTAIKLVNKAAAGGSASRKT